MARHRETMSGWLWVLPSLAIPLVIAAASWTNHVASEGDEIAPNVRFAGVEVSGLDPETAADQVSQRETAFLETPVTMDLGDQSVTLTAEEVGYDYHYGDTVEAILAARHSDGPLGEFMSWVTTPFDPVTVADIYVLDEEKARDRLSDQTFVLEQPVEPQLAVDDGEMVVVGGIDGVGVDVDASIRELEAADVASGPIEIVAQTTPVPPAVTDARAQSIATRVNQITDRGLIAALGVTTGRLSPGELRGHFSAQIADGEMTFDVDVEGIQEDLEALFPTTQGNLTKPQLQVVDGEVRVVEAGVPPPVCCSVESVQAAVDELINGGALVYQLETRPDDDPTHVAWATGADVTDVVAEFTTRHPCCESRVTNIQTMADRMRGYYMLPGETLSFNDYIGIRTREKGYVPAGAIRGGYMTDEVGGGVSQFITTMFNAAYFGGLDLDEYQSHSVYFSRYPYGREATLSVPGPDLVLTNSTDYPVLIWPTYDDTSITVTLYSTMHIEVEELEQRISSRGQCRQSAIDRQRSYPDGRVVVDTITAFYRPGDGIDCNGNQIPRPEG